jgi:hypothetical protein
MLRSPIGVACALGYTGFAPHPAGLGRESYFDVMTVILLILITLAAAVLLAELAVPVHLNGRGQEKLTRLLAEVARNVISARQEEATPGR